MGLPGSPGEEPAPGVTFARAQTAPSLAEGRGAGTPGAAPGKGSCQHPLPGLPAPPRQRAPSSPAPLLRASLESDSSSSPGIAVSPRLVLGPSAAPGTFYWAQTSSLSSCGEGFGPVVEAAAQGRRRDWRGWCSRCSRRVVKSLLPWQISAPSRFPTRPRTERQRPHPGERAAQISHILE